MGASFGAGVILLTIGYVAVSQARNSQQHVLSVIPLLFSLQQFIEGLLWLSLQDHAYVRWQPLMLYLFLIPAQVVWPLFIPVCAVMIETNPVRRKLLILTCIIGGITSAIFLYGLFFYNASASIGHHHIRYALDLPFLQQWYGGIPYLAAAVAAPLISSDPRMRLTGLLLLISYLTASLFYKDYIISVWCYFATVISLVALYDIILRNRKDHAHQ
jgi:general stress protein CsbA